MCLAPCILVLTNLYSIYYIIKRRIYTLSCYFQNTWSPSSTMKATAHLLAVAVVVVGIGQSHFLESITKSSIPDISENLMSVLANTINQSIKHESSVSVLISDNHSSYFDVFSSRINIPFVITLDSLLQECVTKETEFNHDLLKFIEKCEVYIFFLIDPTAILDYLSCDNNPLKLNTMAIFLFIVSSEEIEHNVQKILQIAWKKKKILHGVVILLTRNTLSLSNTSDSVKTYIGFVTYNPFTEVQEIHIEPSTKSRLHINLNSSKLLNLHGYPVTISYINHYPSAEVSYDINGSVLYKGTVGKPFHTFSQYMNFTPELKIKHNKLNYGTLLPNETWTGVIGDVAHNRVDMSLNGMFMSYSRTQAVDFTDTILIMQLRFLLPKASLIPAWKLIFLVYDNISWFAIGAALIITEISFLMALRVLQTSDYLSGTIHSILYVLAISVSVSVPKQPETKVLRALFMISTCFNLIIHSIYTGTIIKMYTKPHYYKDINNIEELVRSGLQVTVVPRSMEYVLKDSDNKELRMLAKRLVKYDNVKLIVDNIVTENNLAVLGAEAFLKLNVYCKSAELTSRLNFVNEAVGVYNVHIILNKHSPYLSRINSILGRIHQSGLSVKWYHDIVFCKIIRVSDDNDVALSLEHTQTVFYILVFGLVIGFTIFVLEYLSTKFRI